jgi:membrane protein implicated in regulation of membrane protease activity
MRSSTVCALLGMGGGGAMATGTGAVWEMMNISLLLTTVRVAAVSALDRCVHHAYVRRRAEQPTLAKC